MISLIQAVPNQPYDTTGYTLALQMGIQFDRVIDGFDGPFVEAPGLQIPPAGKISGSSSPAGYLVSHRTNNFFILVNRLLKTNCNVYWLDKATTMEGKDLGTGAIWVTASPTALEILRTSTKRLA
jgi:hypothetical protein